ncbi:hypothetical protein [Rathayibacter sp. AY1D1]|uniref:hypothetical protein n=1 Tax=Rathayibacter sp. AY1D1 TaxID=2080542 RepID=UPI0015E312C9|nr:hypothetical protein [Rathayibacter sp. AY1D1]
MLELLAVGDADGSCRALTAAEARVLAVVESEGGYDAATVARLSGESLDSALSALGALLADGRVHRSEDGDWERAPG